MNKHFIINIILSIFCIGSVYSNSDSPSEQTSSTIKILPLGNSITFDNRKDDTRSIGEKAGYRGQLYNLLSNAGFKFDFIGSEYSGGSHLPAGFDEHGGFPGITDDQLLYLLQTGHLFQPAVGIDRQVSAGPYLDTYSPDVILLHIGTNDNQLPEGTSPLEVEAILDLIDQYEIGSDKEVFVFITRIINRVPNENYVTEFNDNVEAMVNDRINNPLNDAYPDNILMVDMEDSAGFNYTISPDPDGSPGDMNDALHPNDKGFMKMAQVWFDAIKSVLPNPPLIVEQPQDAYSVSGSKAEFSVEVESNDPVTLQWRKNGLNIPLANSSKLVLTDLSSEDDLARINCLVTNANGSIFSEEAVLYLTSGSERISYGILAQYDFEEGEGDKVYNLIGENGDLDLQINSQQSVEWISNGISISNSADIYTTSSAAVLSDSIGIKNEFTFELWISSSQEFQSGPARIVTISENISERNFTLGQNLNNFVLRTRTTETDLNGLPEFSTHTEVSENELLHVVVTGKSNGFQKIFINGEKSDSTYIEGDLSNWDREYKLAIGNEFMTNQPWLGNIYYLAVYNRALEYAEIYHNFELGESGITNSENMSSDLPSGYSLLQNYPNPFNPTTSISFDLPEPSFVNLTVYNFLGQRIKNIADSKMNSGYHTIKLDASGLSSGYYVYRLNARGENGRTFTEAKKMLLLK